MVIGQGWIALKPEYCIRERQLVRSQNRLSYERGWMRRGGRRKSSRDWNGKQGARVRSTGGGGQQETLRLVAMGRRGSSKPLHHYLLSFTCREDRVCVQQRGCISSERSQEDAEVSLIFSLWRAYCCLQTSGLTLISHIQTWRRSSPIFPSFFTHIFLHFHKKIYSFAFYQILFRSKKVECGNSLSVFWPKKDKLLKIAGLCCV